MTVKFVPLAPMPPAVTTAIGPEDAPAGTLVTLMSVADSTVKLKVGTPLNNTALTPAKFVPLTRTLLPAVPLVGVKPVTVGAADAAIVRFVLLLAMPPFVKTEIGPFVAPTGTTTDSCVELLTDKPVACTPLMVTLLTFEKFVPVTTTVCPRNGVRRKPGNGRRC